MGLALDTSALIALERAASGVSPDLADETLILPAIVWAEAQVGVRMANSKRIARMRQERLERLRERFTFAPFADPTAEIYAKLVCDLTKTGNLIPQNDIAVAATALEYNFGVLVGPSDEAHFRRITDLRVVVL